ncbi:MAG: hypothetical protein ACRDZW_03105 [Acidimicrobiales bacterium]
MLHTALATAACLVALAFTMSSFERWLADRRPHELAWSLALAMFSLASAALAAGAALGWDAVTFRLFYLFGAIVNVPVLALGTVYLLGGRRRGNPTAVAVGLFCAFAAGVVAVAPLTAALPRDELARGSEVFGPLPRILAASASGVGALVVVAGAVWSAIKRRRGRLVAANVLIALGTAVTGASGLFNSVLDEMTGFEVSLVIGIAVIFAGFLVATTNTTRRPPKPGSAPDDQELHQGRAEDDGQQDGQRDGRASPHFAASRVMASPGRSRSSSAADRRSSATDTRP